MRPIQMAARIKVPTDNDRHRRIHIRNQVILQQTFHIDQS